MRSAPRTRGGTNICLASFWLPARKKSQRTEKHGAYAHSSAPPRPVSIPTFFLRSFAQSRRSQRGKLLRLFASHGPGAGRSHHPNLSRVAVAEGCACSRPPNLAAHTVASAGACHHRTCKISEDGAGSPHCCRVWGRKDIHVPRHHARRCRH